MSSEYIENHTYNEIEPGQTAELTKTLTADEVALFGRVSGDLNPTHIAPADTQTDVSTLTAHSIWNTSLVSGLLGNRLPGPGTVHLREEAEFLAPVHIGETVVASVRVEEKKANNVVSLSFLVALSSGTPVARGKVEVTAPTKKIRIKPGDDVDITVNHHDSFSELTPLVKGLRPVKTAVIHPCDAVSLRGAIDAAEDGFIEPVLVGPENKILQVAKENGIDLRSTKLIQADYSHDAAVKAVDLVNRGEVNMLMKGSLHSDEVLDAVIDKVNGIRTERRISHVFVMDVPSYPKLLLVTDAAVNIAPSLDTKRDICQNAIDLACSIDIVIPKVAVLSAVETVRPKIPSTIEAAALCKMADRGQITGGRLDGPLAMDNAVSMEAVRLKGIQSDVAGDADILVVPDLESGNILAKQLTYLAGADAAGIVLGAKVPIILTSRADSVRSRRASAAIAMLHAHKTQSQSKAGGIQ